MVGSNILKVAMPLVLFDVTVVLGALEGPGFVGLNNVGCGGRITKMVLRLKSEGKMRPREELEVVFELVASVSACDLFANS